MCIESKKKRLLSHAHFIIVMRYYYYYYDYDNTFSAKDYFTSYELYRYEMNVCALSHDAVCAQGNGMICEIGKDGNFIALASKWGQQPFGEWSLLGVCILFVFRLFLQL